MDRHVVTIQEVWKRDGSTHGSKNAKTGIPRLYYEEQPAIWTVATDITGENRREDETCEHKDMVAKEPKDMV